MTTVRSVDLSRYSLACAALQAKLTGTNWQDVRLPGVICGHCMRIQVEGPDPVASLKSENTELQEGLQKAVQETEALKQENQKLRKDQQDAKLDR